MNIECDYSLLKPFIDQPQDRELCGLLLGHRDNGGYVITNIVQVPNRSDHPESSSLIMKQDVAPVLAEYSGSLLGWVHTHYRSAAHPSYADVENLPVNLLGMVLHVGKKLVTYYNRHGYIREVQL